MWQQLPGVLKDSWGRFYSGAKDAVGTARQLPGVLRDSWGELSHDTMVNAGHGMLDTFFAGAHLANTAYGAAQRWATPATIGVPQPHSPAELKRVFGSRIPQEYYQAMVATNRANYLKQTKDHARRSNLLADWEQQARANLPKPIADRGAGAKAARFGGVAAGAIPFVFAARGAAQGLSKLKVPHVSAPTGSAGWVQPLLDTATFTTNTMLGTNAVGKGMYLLGAGSNMFGGARNATGATWSPTAKKVSDSVIGAMEAAGRYSIPYYLQNKIVQSPYMQRAYANTASTFAGRPEILGNTSWFNPDVNRLMLRAGGVNVNNLGEYTTAANELPTPDMKAAHGIRTLGWWLGRNKGQGTKVLTEARQNR